MTKTTRHSLLSVRNEAYELFLKGYGYKKAARELDLSRYTVRDWFRAFRQGNIEYVLKPRATRPHDKKLREKVVIERLCHGTPFSELAARHKVPAFTIRQWINRYRDGKLSLDTVIAPELLTSDQHGQCVRCLNFEEGTCALNLDLSSNPMCAEAVLEIAHVASDD